MSFCFFFGGSSFFFFFFFPRDFDENTLKLTKLQTLSYSSSLFFPNKKNKKKTHYQHHHQQQQTLGGWTSPKVVNDFGNYAAAVFKELGGTGRGKASDFLTMNEPKNAAFLGYAVGVHAPFLRAPPTNASQGWTALLHMLEAHAAAVKAYKKAGLKGRIGVALDSEWTLPVDPEKDTAAAQRYIDYRLGAFADPLYFGQWPASVRERLEPTGELPPIPRELSEFLVENKPKTFFLN